MPRPLEYADDSQDIGRIFGKWKVLAVGFYGWRRLHSYVCRCTGCNETYQTIPRARLHRGATKSCMKCRDSHKGANAYQWRGAGVIPGNMAYQIRKGAESRGLPFNITVQDMYEQWQKQDGRCALTGEKLYVRTREERTASLDRISSERGYEKDNIQWVHKQVNLMKHAIPETRFVELCAKVVAHRGMDV